jgi:hypothetical protein
MRIIKPAYPWDGTRTDANDKGTPSSDETSSWCNGDKSSNNTLDSSNHCRTFEVNVIENNPYKHRNSSGKISVDNGSTSIGRSGIRITTVLYHH